MTQDFKTRLEANLTNDVGQFHFPSTREGTYYLRFRYRGFNDYLVPVQMSPSAAKGPIRVSLEISN